MRSDILVDKKCVHIKLSKEVHFALRTKLFKHNISMQELFDEFARLVAEDAPKGQSIVDHIVNKKIKLTLSTSSLSSKKSRRKKEQFKEFDSEALYNMINGLDEEA